MKVGVIGAVGTTALTINKLVQHGVEVAAVLGHEPAVKGKVAGLNNLRRLCLELKIDFKGYTIINSPNLLNWFRSLELDFIFAVGFSQLLNEEWLSISKHGCIGFHPTRLPKGRGRAPIAWLILDGNSGAASLFKMGMGADDGPIYIQENFEIENYDDVESIIPKVHNSLAIALDKLIPKLINNNWELTPQNEEEATWFGKRDPIDGFINWNFPAINIDRLIKASTNPYPGAFSFIRGNLIKIWKSEVDNNSKIKGVVGRILTIDEKKGALIQCGDGKIWIKSYKFNILEKLKIGDFLGGEIPYDKISQINNNLIENNF